MIKLVVQVIARVNTRSTSYNVKDVERALTDAGLQPVRNGPFFVAEHSYSSKDETIAARKRIETALKRVHRNILYRFEFEGV